jgi:hypothetical protein
VITPPDPETEKKRLITKSSHGIGGMLLIKTAVEYVSSIILVIGIILYLVSANAARYDLQNYDSIKNMMQDVLNLINGNSLASKLINLILYVVVLSLPILFYKSFHIKSGRSYCPCGLFTPIRSDRPGRNGPRISESLFRRCFYVWPPLLSASSVRNSSVSCSRASG